MLKIRLGDLVTRFPYNRFSSIVVGFIFLILVQFFSLINTDSNSAIKCIGFLNSIAIFSVINVFVLIIGQIKDNAVKIIYFDDQTREFSCILKVLGLPIFKEQVPLDEIQEFYAIFAPGGPDVMGEVGSPSHLKVFARLKSNQTIYIFELRGVAYSLKYSLLPLLNRFLSPPPVMLEEVSKESKFASYLQQIETNHLKNEKILRLSYALLASYWIFVLISCTLLCC